MDCANCSERLADFLLDELPESEAVLVQEHLNLCPSCMRTYKELKGTGKALEAVPAMRPIEGSPEFRQVVRSQAAVELARILERLPPEKRLKLEARRAARISRVAEKPAPRRKAVSWRVVAGAAAGAVALAVILAYPSSSTPAGERQPVGCLSIAAGTVEQFYQRAYQPHTPVKEGKAVLPGDAFLTADKGRARFDLQDGGALFLGPASQMTFRAPPLSSPHLIVVLEQGQLGLLRPRRAVGGGEESPPEPHWEVRSEVGTLLVGSGAHVYLSVVKAGGEYKGELAVLVGSAEVIGRSGRPLGTVSSYHRAALGAADSALRAEPREKLRMPEWRLDLISEGELATLLGARVRVLERHEGAVAAEVVYGSGAQKQGQRDWLPEPTGTPTAKAAGTAAARAETGGVNVPAGTRLRHIVPFAAPLSVELTLARDCQGEIAFAFGAAGTPEGGVAVDVARDAMLQIRDRCRTVRSASVPVRNSTGKLERLRLEIVREAAGAAAQLSSPAAKSDPLPLPRAEGAPRPISGKLWLQSLGDAVLFDEVRVTGLVPGEWLREKLSR